MQSQLAHYVDINYYLAGASAVESDPVVATLQDVDVSADMLSELTDIVKLRQDSVVKEFKHCYSTIIENVRQALPEPTASVYDAKRLAQEAKQIMGSYVRDKLRRELASERSARDRKSNPGIRIRYCIGVPLSLPLLPLTLQTVGGVTGAAGTALQLADPLLQKILVEPKRGSSFCLPQDFTSLSVFIRKY